MSPAPHHVKNSFILSHFLNHSQPYYGKVPFRLEIVSVQLTEGTGIGEVSHLCAVYVFIYECCVCSRTCGPEGQPIPQAYQRADCTLNNQLPCLVLSPGIGSRQSRAWISILSLNSWMCEIWVVLELLVLLCTERTISLQDGVRSPGDHPLEECFLCPPAQPLTPSKHSFLVPWLKHGQQEDCH